MRNVISFRRNIMHFENYSNRYSNRIIIDIDYSITHFFLEINESIDFIILCQVSILYDSLISFKNHIYNYLSIEFSKYEYFVYIISPFRCNKSMNHRSKNYN